MNVRTSKPGDWKDCHKPIFVATETPEQLCRRIAAEELPGWRENQDYGWYYAPDDTVNASGGPWGVDYPAWVAVLQPTDADSGDEVWLKTEREARDECRRAKRLYEQREVARIVKRGPQPNVEFGKAVHEAVAKSKAPSKGWKFKSAAPDATRILREAEDEGLDCIRLRVATGRPEGIMFVRGAAKAACNKEWLNEPCQFIQFSAFGVESPVELKDWAAVRLSKQVEALARIRNARNATTHTVEVHVEAL